MSFPCFVPDEILIQFFDYIVDFVRGLDAVDIV